VARRLQGCVREQDLVVRLGGDEFAAVLVDEDDEQRAVSVAERVLEVLDAPVRIAGVDVRVGLHTGEIELRGEDIGGVAVHVAQRVCGHAESGEVLVSEAVPLLVAGSGIRFEDRGARELKGVPGTSRLFAAEG